MKKLFGKILALALSVSVLTCALPLTGLAAAPAGWDGTADTAWYGGQTSYTLTTAGQLAGLAKLVNAGNTFSGVTFTLGNDIDLSGHEWTPIGWYDTAANPYKSYCFDGTFDGGGHTVSGVSVGTADTPAAGNGFTGLFGAVGDDKAAAKITNLHVKDFYINCRQNCGSFGALASRFYNGSIENCSASDVTIRVINTPAAYDQQDIGSNTVGGLVGAAGDCNIQVTNSRRITGCTVSGCRIDAELTGDAGVLSNAAGGLVAIAKNTAISRCAVSGSIKCSGSAGGLAGEIYGDSAGVDQSCAVCPVEAYIVGDSDTGCAGGLVGWSQTRISNSFATGNVTATGGRMFYIGGLVGDNDSENCPSIITNCYATGNVAADNKSDDIGGLAGESVGENDCSVVNSYATGSVSLSDPGASAGSAKMGGFIGSDGATVTNGYWNSDAAQTLNGSAVTSKGMGESKRDAQGGATGMKLADMRSAAFAQTLTANRTDAAVQKPWKHLTDINDNLPFLDGVGQMTGASKIIQLPATGNITIVSKLKDVALTGGSANVPGKFSWTNPGATVTASGQYEVTFTPTDAADYSSCTDMVNVTVAPEVKNNQTGIRLDLSGATLPSGVTSVSAKIAALPQSGGSSAYRTVAGLIGNGNYSNLIVYDFQLLDQNGNPFEPAGGAVTVRIPIPSGMSGNLHVFWYNPAAGALTDMNAAQVDGYLVFTTTHFSDYAVAQLVSSAGGGNSTGGGSSNGISTGGTSSGGNTSGGTSSGMTANPKTGSESFPVMPMALLGACSAAGLVVMRKHAKYRVNRVKR